MKKVTLFLILLSHCLCASEKNAIIEKSSDKEWIDFLHSFRHYAKFYGDPETKHGNFFERSYILSDLGGFRDRLVDHGIYLDASISQFFATNCTGGEKNDFMRTNGSAEYWLIYDTTRAGLWKYGAFMLHAKTTWNADKSVAEDVGSIVAANVDSRTPVAGESTTALSEVAFGQIFSDSFSLRIGKLDATGPLDDNEFANNARYQFIYSGLVNNPIILTFLPHTLLSVIPIWKASEKQIVKVLIGDADGTADSSGFSTLFNGNTTMCFQYQLCPTPKDLPGNYRFILSYSTKPVTNYAIDSRHVLGKQITDITIPEKAENYAWCFSFDQYLWKKEATGEGAGLFGRLGDAPPDRNVIDQFYSIGIGGKGMIFKNRPHDEWGIGYAATHISAPLRDDLQSINIKFGEFEHAVEAYYNLEVTPSVHWTTNVQIIRQPLETYGTAFVISMRLRFDF